MSDDEKSTTIQSPRQNGNDGDLEHAATHGTYLEKDEVANLSEEHRQFLLQRHGTLELDPVPLMTDADPYNWPSWKVRISLSHLSDTTLTSHCRKSRTFSSWLSMRACQPSLRQPSFQPTKMSPRISELTCNMHHTSPRSRLLSSEVVLCSGALCQLASVVDRSSSSP